MDVTGIARIAYACRKFICRFCFGIKADQRFLNDGAEFLYEFFILGPGIDDEFIALIIALHNQREDRKSLGI